MPRYELVEGTSSKFWQIDLNGTSFTTTFGRIGTSGQAKSKDFGDAAEARRAYDKLVAEKVKKGYALVSDAAPAAPPPARVAAPPAPAAVTPPAPPAQIRLASEFGRLTWTPKLDELAMSNGVKAAASPIELGDPEALYQQINRWTRDIVKPAIENGMQTFPERAPLAKKVTWSYFAAKAPEKLDAETEGAAFLLLTSAPGTPIQDIASSMIRFWVAHSGLPFAIEAWARSLSPLCAKAYGWQQTPKVVLMEAEAPPLMGAIDAGGPPADRIGRNGALPLLRELLRQADEKSATEARARAARLRDAGDMVTRIGLGGLLEDETWLRDAASARDSKDHEVFVLEWSVLSNAEPNVLVEVFARMGLQSCWHLGSRKAVGHAGYREVDVSALAQLLHRYREAALPAAFAWVRRCVDFAADAGYPDYQMLRLLNALLTVLESVSDSPPFAAVLADLLTRLGKGKFNKDEDPRILALRLLTAMPAAALATVRTGSNRNVAWAKRLLPQLERATGEVELAEVASDDRIPAELKGKRFKAEFWDAQKLPQILLHDGGALPCESIDAIGLALSQDDAVVLNVAKTACTPRSLARFAWELFLVWESAGAPSKHKWAMMALGWFGDDEAAQNLTTLIRRWPGESQHKRAVNGLEVLSAIGTDVALMCLNGIAQKVKFKGLQRNARDKMNEIAERRGFTTEELEDRLVPDLDLEDDGSMELDFGARSFRVGFDEALKPYVIDATGKRRGSLPNPGAKDDAALAQESIERFKAMKTSVRALASIQVARLEQAMGRRRWPAADFDAFLVHHPLMIHLVRRVVWGVLDGEGRPTTCFRVAEDRSYADIDEAPFTIPSDATIGLVHRLHLSDDQRAKWRTIFTDYELVAPFDQLDRDIFRLEPADTTEETITRYEGREVETGKLRGLVSRGWRHGTPQDAGMYHCFGKPIREGLHAWLPIESGISVSGGGYDDETQTLGAITFSNDEPWGWSPQSSGNTPVATIDDITISELLRDIESLGEVTKEE